MRVRYIGKSFGIDGLSGGKEYEVDDSGEDYLYDPHNPRPIANPDHPGGRFEIVEDDASGTLRNVIFG